MSSILKVDEIQNTGGTTGLTIDSSGDLTFNGSNTDTPTDSGWIQPTLNSGWSHYSSPYGPVKYRRIGSIVNIQGIANGATQGTNVFQLPAGYRPERRIIIAALNDGASVRVDIKEDGNFNAHTISSSGGWLSCACTFFTA